MNQRSEDRYAFIHNAHILSGGRETIGEVIDWSHHGVQVCAHLTLDPRILYEVRFHVEHTGEEQYDIWKRDGEIRWVRTDGVICWFGILFTVPLEDQIDQTHRFPIDHLGEYLHPEDVCHLHILPKALRPNGEVSTR